jgi:hypothetical protein
MVRLVTGFEEFCRYLASSTDVLSAFQGWGAPVQALFAPAQGLQ